MISLYTMTQPFRHAQHLHGERPEEPAQGGQEEQIQAGREREIRGGLPDVCGQETPEGETLTECGPDAGLPDI